MMKRLTVLTLVLFFGAYAAADDLKNVVAEDELVVDQQEATKEQPKEDAKLQASVEEEVAIEDEDKEVVEDSEEVEADNESAEELLNTLLASAAEEMNEGDFERDLEDGMKHLEDLLA